MNVLSQHKLKLISGGKGGSNAEKAHSIALDMIPVAIGETIASIGLYNVAQNSQESISSMVLDLVFTPLFVGITFYPYIYIQSKWTLDSINPENDI